MTRSSRASFQSKSQKTAALTISEWEDLLNQENSFEKKIAFLFRSSADVSSKSKDKNFQSFEDKDTVRKFLIHKLSEFEENVIKLSPETTPDFLCHLIGTYSRLRISPDPDMMSYFKERTSKNMPDMTAVQLRHVIDACVDLAIYPGDEWMGNWSTGAKNKWGEWSLKDGYAVLQKMAILDFLRADREATEDSPVRKLASDMMNFVQKNPHRFITDKIDRQLYLAGLWFGYEFVKDYPIEAETHMTSKTEVRFTNLLRQAGIRKSDDDMMISGIDHKIDIPITHNDIVIACEVDGAYHLLEDKRTSHMIYDGQSRFQTWVINELMPENTQLLRIPDIVAKQNPHPRVWKDIFNRASAKGAGSYILHACDDIREACAPDAWDISLK